MTLSRDLMRVRLSDPTLMDEFVEFLGHTGFSVEVADGDTVRLTLPLTPGPNRTESDLRVLLAVWLDIGLRIWRDLWPDVDAIVLAEPEPVERSASARA
jgi:hypothetical protein